MLQVALQIKKYFSYQVGLLNKNIFYCSALIVIILVFSSAVLHAQKELVNGTIITLQGETLTVKIKPASDDKLAKGISVYNDTTEEYKKYSTKEISYFKYDQDEYFAKTEAEESKKVFMKREIDGPATLYTYTYKVEKGNDKVEVLFVSGPGAMAMAIHANGGFPARSSFVLQTVMWFIFTGGAWYYAIKKKFTKHAEMMLLSYSLTFAAVTLRVLKIIFTLLEVKFTRPVDAYISVAWLSWVPNMIIAALLIHFGLIRWYFKKKMV